MPSLDPTIPLVLVVDDQPTLRFFVAETLLQAGFEVAEAENGVQALALFQTLAPDFIMLDVMMPELDGFAACAEIRRLNNGAHVPVLMMTGIDDEDSIRRAYDVGATDFIAKPINRVVLPHRVRYMLRAQHTADKLRESEARLGDAQRLAQLGHWHWDLQYQSVHCSDVCQQLLSLPIGQFKGDYKMLLGSVVASERVLVQQAAAKAMQEHTTATIEHRVQRADSSELVLCHTIEAIAEDNQIVRVIGTVQDVTARKKAEKRIYSLAYQDQLTGLSNRTYLKEFLSTALSHTKRNEHFLALLYLDLDHFKRINDTLGHGAGDQLLREVGVRLRQCVRGSDTVARPIPNESSLGFPLVAGTELESIARLGGDEFIIVLSQLQEATEAGRVAQRIIEALARPITVEGHEVFISTSIGITLFPSDGDDEDTLLKNADIAMYHAKEKGRNNYQFFKSSLNAAIVKRLALENKLRKAIENDEFFLNYQPKFDIATGQATGMEALLRWRQANGKLISPAEFIPYAEDSGLIVPIGEWVLRAACVHNKTLHSQGLPPLRMAINLSAQEFRKKELPDRVERLLAEIDLAPHYLELEITERMLMEHVDSTKRTLDALKAMGVTISVDDFGTGYSSLSYLNQFPIDVLKIDQSFTKGLDVDSDSQAITKAIISMAQSLNLKVVAEGVETAGQFEWLQKHGCDEVQGYLFSQPVAADEIGSVLARNIFESNIVQFVDPAKKLL